MTDDEARRQRAQDLYDQWLTCLEMQNILRFLDSPAPSPPVPLPDPSVIGYRAPAGTSREPVPDPCGDLKRRYDEAREEAREAWERYEDAREREATADAWFNRPPTPDPDSISAQQYMDEQMRAQCRKSFPGLTPEQLQQWRARHAKLVDEADDDWRLKNARIRMLKVVDEEIASELRRRAR